MFVKGGIVHDHAHITSVETIQAKIEEVCVKFTHLFYCDNIIYHKYFFTLLDWTHLRATERYQHMI